MLLYLRVFEDCTCIFAYYKYGVRVAEQSAGAASHVDIAATLRTIRRLAVDVGEAGDSTGRDYSMRSHRKRGYGSAPNL